MPFKLRIATADDVPDLVVLRAAVSQDMTSKFGKGPWSTRVTDKGLFFAMKRSTVYIARRRGEIVATLSLSTRKPWAIDTSYFSSCSQPLYLTGMEVAPARQRQGIGRMCIDEARRLAIEWPGGAIRLDAFDSSAGAGEFYRKCGFQEVGRTTYRTAPLIYFEMLL